MPAYFDVLREGSDAHTVEPNADGFIIRPTRGLQIEFDRIASLTIERAADDFAVFPMTNTACGWSSLALLPYEMVGLEKTIGHQPVAGQHGLRSLKEPNGL